MEVSVVGITAVLFTKDHLSRWVNIDESICRLEILKNEKENKYRMVAMATDGRCVFNKWVRTNGAITKLSEVFLEIKQTPSQSTKTDYVGLNCAYREEVDEFLHSFNSCINSLKTNRNTLTNSQSVTEDLSKMSISLSSSMSFDSLNLTANGVFDLPLPPPPPPFRNMNPENTPDVHATTAAAAALPPPPPSVLSNSGFIAPPPTSLNGSPALASSPQISPHTSASIPPNSVPPTSSLSSSSQSIAGHKSTSFSTAPASISSIFTPPPSSSPTNSAVTTTITTTTTVTRVGNANGATEAVIKTANGRRSIRARSSTSIKTLSKKDGLAISLQNVEGLQNIGENIEEETLNLLDLVNEQVVNPSSSVSLINSINKIYEHLQVLFILTQDTAANHHGAKLVSAATNRISRGAPSISDLTGITGWNWFNHDEVSSINTGMTSLLIAKKNLVPTLAYLSTSVRVLGLQTSLEAEWMSRNQSSEPESIVVQLACLSRELMTCIARLLSATQLFCQISTSIKSAAEAQNSLLGRGRSQSTSDTVNIWDEFKQINQQLPQATSTTGLKATLNQLVLLLTSESNYDPKFLNTFITTYQSFASPNQLFAKLVERYTVPDWFTTVKQKISTIQSRVIVILKYWIVNQSSDFDQELVDQIYYFLENTLIADGYIDLSKTLKETLDKLMNDRDVKLELLFLMPPRIQFEEDSTLSPVELFYEWSAVSIAQQLTLIDFAIFKEVEARELLNQNFNKPKSKYRAPNIMRLINRSTQFSFWVAGLIALEGKKERRVKVFEKLLDIAKQLLKLHNYNTLMSLVAGLNLTPIHRLKKTKKKLSSSALSTLAECERIFASKKSFKTYRDLIATVTNTPCIPYIGINLTDITFIEEGNPDYIQDATTASGPIQLGPMINFKKRELFFQAWTDISRHQNVPYQFTTEEPQNTFLLHFALLEEKELYDLSIALEPR